MGSYINAPLAMGSPSMDFNNPQGSYNSAYQNYVNLNSQLYNNYVSNQNSMLGGYQQLQSNVMNRLRGGNRANLQDIANKYSTFSGQASQQMIDRGLGNTTIQQSMQRGIQNDKTQETTRSRNMYSQLMANMQSQLGQARLGAQGHGLDMLLTQVSAPPPDAGMYAQLAQMKAMGQMPGQLPSMPGASPAFAPTGGYQPQGLFSSGYDTGSGGGGGGYSIFDMPQGNGYVAPVTSFGAGAGGNGQNYSDLYAGGNYGGMYANPAGAGGSYEGFGLA